MTPTQQKYFRIDIAMIAIMVVYILICVFCPSPNIHCPACNFTPTIYEARQTNYCPECGTRYNRDDRCANCGEPCDTPYCPHCGSKNKEE